MAFQMVVIMAIGAFAGQKLDEKFATSKPWFTVLFGLLAVFASLYLTLKDFIFPKEK